MTKAILMAWHKFTPFGGKFYEPILDFQLKTLERYQDEFDKVYLIDSTWDIKLIEVIKRLPIPKFEIIKVNPSLRYYNAYKEILPQIKEDLVLFMDNDMVVYKKGKIKDTFDILKAKDIFPETNRAHRQCW